MASWNSVQVEEVDVADYEGLLRDDIEAAAWDREFAGFAI